MYHRRGTTTPPKSTFRVSPQRAGQHHAPPRTKKTNKTSRLVHHPLPGVVTREKPGPTQDCRRQKSEIVILRRRGRRPKASQEPRGAGPKAFGEPEAESMPRERAEGDRREAAGVGGGRAASKGGNGNATLKGAGRVGNGPTAVGRWLLVVAARPSPLSGGGRLACVLRTPVRTRGLMPD